MNECEKAKRADRQTERQTKVEADTLFQCLLQKNGELVLYLFVVVVVVALSWTSFAGKGE